MERGCNHYRRVSEFGVLMVLSVLMSPDPQKGAATVLRALLSPGSPQESVCQPWGCCKVQEPP